LLQKSVARTQQSGQIDPVKATITSENIGNESYYNLVMLARLTGYANPVGAIKALNAKWDVIKDACGNITGMV
jgi:hypothetical protein